MTPVKVVEIGNLVANSKTRKFPMMIDLFVKAVQLIQ